MVYRLAILVTGKRIGALNSSMRWVGSYCLHIRDAALQQKQAKQPFNMHDGNIVTSICMHSHLWTIRRQMQSVANLDSHCLRNVSLNIRQGTPCWSTIGDWICSESCCRRMKRTIPTSKAQLTRNVPKYFLYAILKNLGFGLFVAVWVIYLQQRRGLNLAQATVVDVTFLITATFGELPTGIVADTYGRKTSMVIGAALMAISMLAWPLVPTLLLVVVAYAGMALGFTFLSGADEALFFESLKSIGRGGEYQRLAGQIGAVSLGSFAIGNAMSGLLASRDLITPFLGGGLCIVIVFGIVLTLKEPPNRVESESRDQNSYGRILREALAVLKIRPALRYPMFYLAFMPLAGFLLETFLVQPQAVSFGLPVAAIGFIIMAIQLVNIAGSNWSQQISRRVGEKQVIYLSPLTIVASLILLALFQVPASLFFIAVIGFVTAVLQPLVMNRIQTEVTDNIRATILSMQSLLGSLLMSIGELAVGYVANQVGLPIAYIVLAIGLITLSIILLWNSRNQFPRSAESV